MKQRNPVVQALLSFFIPFYVIYWSYAVAKEMEVNYRHKAPNIMLLLIPVIIFILAVVVLLGGVINGTDESGFAVGIGFFLLIIILYPVSLILTVLYYYRFGENVEKIAGPSLGQVVVTVIAFLFTPVTVYLVQDKFNKITQKP